MLNHRLGNCYDYFMAQVLWLQVLHSQAKINIFSTPCLGIDITKPNVIVSSPFNTEVCRDAPGGVLHA
jgi:hypothetical protein